MTTDTYDYQRHSILFVDDEAISRKYFRRLFSGKFRILEAEDGVQALEIFKQNVDDIGIIVTDQRMPNETGVGFLSKIAADHPDVIKILSTAYTDIDAAIGSVNQGGIFRYVTKPWDIPELEVTLRRAMEFFMLKKERDALLRAKMLAMGNVLLANRLAAFAFVPVSTGIRSEHAAQAIASFLRAAISSPAFQPDPQTVVATPDLARLHARQMSLAGMLATELPAALAAPDLSSRIQSLATTLTQAGAQDVQCGPDSLTASTDPTPALVAVLLGNDQEQARSEQAVRILAAFMALHDAGVTVQRQRGAALNLQISPRSPGETASPGTAAAKWLMEDELLVSAALGLI